VTYGVQLFNHITTVAHAINPPLYPDQHHLLSGGALEAGIILVPGTLAGLNDLSQSAYAAPAPNPVVKAIGHVRRRKRMTDAITPTPKPTPALTIKSARQRSYFWETMFSLDVGFDGEDMVRGMDVLHKQW